MLAKTREVVRDCNPNTQEAEAGGLAAYQNLI